MSNNHKELITNSLAPWNDFNPAEYHKQYLGAQPIPEDNTLPYLAVAMLRSHDGIALGSMERGIDVGNGGVGIGPTLIAPYLKDSPQSRLEWMDYGAPQVSAAARLIEAGKHGGVGRWQMHEDRMAQANPEWHGALRQACRLGEAVTGSIFELPADTYDIAVTCYCPESLTEDPAEWERALQRFYGSLKPGGVGIVFSMYESTGWGSAGPDYPAVSITEADVTRQAVAAGMTGILRSSIPASHAARTHDDPSSYTAMGVVTAIKQ